MILFEIHTFRSGQWKIDSVFDDKELAIYEAQRIEKAGRFPAVRVIQEIYDEDTQRTSVRTVYRTSKVDAANVEASRRRAQPLTVAAPPPRPRPKKSGVSPAVLLLTLVLIVLGGLGALYLLQVYSASF
jgi:hypothetical protein